MTLSLDSLTFGPARMTWGIKTNSRVFTSPLTQESTFLELPGAKWNCMASYNDLEPDQRDELEALIMQLRGPTKTIAISDPLKNGQHAEIAQSSIISASGVTVNLNIAFPLIKVGDRVEIQDSEGNPVELKTVVEKNPASTEITVEPPLRGTYGAESFANFYKPKANFSLIDDNQFSAKIRAPFLSSFTLSFEERF